MCCPEFKAGFCFVADSPYTATARPFRIAGSAVREFRTIVLLGVNILNGGYWIRFEMYRSGRAPGGARKRGREVHEDAKVPGHSGKRWMGGCVSAKNKQDLEVMILPSLVQKANTAVLQ